MSCLTCRAGVDPPDRKGTISTANEEAGFGGIDSHLDTVAVIAANGRHINDQEFPGSYASAVDAVFAVPANQSVGRCPVHMCIQCSARLAGSALESLDRGPGAVTRP